MEKMLLSHGNRSIIKAGPVVFVLCLLALFSCARTNEDHENWKKERLIEIKKEDGWLNLAGLFWLKEGENTFGADSSNHILFPAEKAPAFLGIFRVQGDSVFLIPNSSEEILIGGERAQPQPVFPAQKLVEMQHSDLLWFIIKRGDRFAIRLRDLDHVALQSFSGIETYPYNPEWALKATFLPQESSLTILDVLGMKSEQKSPGKLIFEVNGVRDTLETIDYGKEFFVIFADETNRNETYASGRYLYVKKPESGSQVLLDFNRAINPPCAFTDFATCPLPPEANRLAFRIEAGEKRPATH